MCVCVCVYKFHLFLFIFSFFCYCCCFCFRRVYIYCIMHKHTQHTRDYIRMWRLLFEIYFVYIWWLNRWLNIVIFFENKKKHVRLVLWILALVLDSSKKSPHKGHRLFFLSDSSSLIIIWNFSIRFFFFDVFGS